MEGGRGLLSEINLEERLVGDLGRRGTQCEGEEAERSVEDCWILMLGTEMSTDHGKAKQV